MNRFGIIGKTALTVLGVLIVILGFKGLLGTYEKSNVLRSAVWLEEAAVLTENEGKVVIIHGVPELIEPAYDEELGLTLNTLKAYRSVEEYRLTNSEDEDWVWDWVSVGTETIVGKAGIGGFVLDGKTLAAFPAESYYSAFDPAEIRRSDLATSRESFCTYVLAGTDLYHSKTDVYRHGYEREGALAYNYRYYDLSREHCVTVAGIQQGGRLVVHESCGPMVTDGELSADEFRKVQTGYGVGGSAVFMLLGLLLVVLGIRRSKDNKEQKR